MGKKLEGLLSVIVLVLVVTAVAMSLSSCDGTLVRGLFWFECIE